MVAPLQLPHGCKVLHHCVLHLHAACKHLLESNIVRNVCMDVMIGCCRNFFSEANKVGANQVGSIAQAVPGFVTIHMLPY